MTALWFFMRLLGVVAISLWIVGLEGSVVVDAYGYKIHIRLWVFGVGIVLFVVWVWYVLRTLGWINAGVVYVTRTRRLYNRLFALPFVTRNSVCHTLKSPALKKLGKKHPLSQVIWYRVDRTYDIQIHTVLSSVYAPHLIQACIDHNDTRHLSTIRAFYTTDEKAEIPDIWYIYESMGADTVQQAVLQLSFVQDKTLNSEVAYYTALAHITHKTADVYTATLHAWKTAQTDREKWRLCMACCHLQLSDISHIVPFENAVHKKDGMGMLLLAILSTQAELWGPADAYIAKSEVLVQTDKHAFVRAYLQYKQYGNSDAYITALHAYIHRQTGVIL